MSFFHGYECEACGKRAEVEVKRSTDPDPPYGWYTLTVHDFPAHLRSPHACSSACAREWLTQDDRRKAMRNSFWDAPPIDFLAGTANLPGERVS